MFCTKCGTRCEEGALFCANCGNALQTPVSEPVKETVNVPVNEPVNEPVKEKTKKTPKKKSKKRIILPIVLVIVLLIVAAGACVGIIAYEGVKCQEIIEDYFKAFEEADVKKLMGYTLPEDVREEWIKDAYSDEDQYWDRIEADLEEELTLIDRFEWEIEKVEYINLMNELEEDMDKYPVDISDMRDVRDILGDNYGEYGLEEGKIKNAYAIEIKVKLEIDGEKESVSWYNIIYKYEGEWYLLRNFSVWSVRYNY